MLQDIRFASRLLLKDRAFSLTILLTLALCIGANAAIFAVVNSVLLRPLPVPEADRLVLLYNSYPKAGAERGGSGVPDYYDRLRETDAFEELALYTTRGMTVGGQGGAQRLTAMFARPSLFRLLRVTPGRGRIFNETEGELGQDRRVLLSHATWQRLFAGQDDAVGKDIRLNGVPYHVVGVMPAGFHFMSADVDMWVPLAFPAELKADDARHNNSWTMIGRMKTGASLEQARQQVDALNARNLERFPSMKEILLNAGFRTVVTPLQQDMIRDVRQTLLLLWAGVLFVLVIGGVNITNLVLIRSSARVRELATRHALGAGMARITRQLLTETLLLTLIGGAAGIVLGYWGLSVLIGAGLEALPRAAEIRMDASAIAFMLGLTLVIGLVVGLVPVVNVRHMNLSQAFREEGRSGTGGRASRMVRRVLVASQVAFAFMLLVGAGLLLASFQRVLAVQPGFEPGHVLTARLAPPAARYKGDADLRAFAARLLVKIRAISGVQNAGLVTTLPFGGDFDDSVILAEGYQMSPGESLVSPYRVLSTPGYMEALGIPLLSGRRFTESDTESSQPVVIVDERLARKFWPGQEPVGRRMFQPENRDDLTKPSANQRWLTVIGVVGETKMAGLVTAEDRVGTYYFPMAQSPFRTMTMAVKAPGNPETSTSALRQALASVDPEVPLYNVRGMQERIDETLTDRRTPMVLALILGAVALFLAAIGLYGALAYQVSQRQKEIGIRMALGSAPRGIAALILREGLGLLGAGVAVGLALAFVIRRAMATQLYGVGAMDPLVFGVVAGVLALVAFVACMVPARRAARIDPLVALSK
ncbi:MAG: ABC transporter permease [Acidobacteria bacterium]|nr:ABC transporter permease [Acidobacteriota bacterium]